MREISTKRLPLFVAIELDGRTTTHVNGGVGDYATICGRALDGDQDSGRQVPLSMFPKVDCPSCRQLFDIAHKIYVTDFV